MSGTITTPAGTFVLSKISGVQVRGVSGSPWILIFGLLVLSVVTPYAGCAYVCVASGAVQTDNEAVLGIIGFGAAWLDVGGLRARR